MARVRDMITDAFFESSLDPLREAPDGWDKARDIIKSFSPQRQARFGRVFVQEDPLLTRSTRSASTSTSPSASPSSGSIYPQGHLSGAVPGLRRRGSIPTRLMISVNADDPWFKRRKVRVISRADFDERSRAIDDGDDDLRRRDEDRAPRQVEAGGVGRVAVDGPKRPMIEPVSLRFEVDLKPVDAGERPNKLLSDVVEVLGEAKEIEPRDLFSLEAIPDPDAAELPVRPLSAGRRAAALRRSRSTASARTTSCASRRSSRTPTGSASSSARRRRRSWRRSPIARRTTATATPPSRRSPGRRWTSPIRSRSASRSTSCRRSNFNEVDRAFVDLEYDDPDERRPRRGFGRGRAEPAGRALSSSIASTRLLEPRALQDHDPHEGFDALRRAMVDDPLATASSCVPT